MMAGSENRGEKQPGRVLLQTGPGRDAIAKSVVLAYPRAGLTARGHVATAYRTPLLPSMLVRSLETLPEIGESGVAHLILTWLLKTPM